MLFHSDRITINSKSDDIYLSSIKDIHIGAGRRLAISTNEDVIIESRKTYLGKNAVNKGEPMVLGNQLLEVLQDTLAALKEAASLFYGSPIPLTDTTGAPFQMKIVPIEQKVNKILSQYHFIEQNGGK